MNYAAFLFGFLITLNIAFGAGLAENIYNQRGNLIITQLFSAPFPHSSRVDGHKYKDELLPYARHYSDSTVALFVPDGFKPSDKVDFVVHFHGWRNNVTNAIERFKPLEMFTSSQRNAVFILPQGPRDAPDSSGGKLEDMDGFKRFITEAVGILSQRGFTKSNASPGQIILSGHSGGYQAISSIVERGGLTENIREVWLFDGLYARSERFLNWSEEKTSRRLINIYTDGGGTKTHTEEMMSHLQQRGTKFISTTDLKVSRSELATNQLVFLRSDMTHNEVFAKRRTFQVFLETSCLEER